ncbi:MAG: T9SS type A sorting domain-containing protein [Bacteroidales bacterium]|nr:T9SS type A sorting domain-containing protein [Bacteroidales bacterium]
MKYLFFLFLLFFSHFLISQTIVSTDPENKNVVLEEFTGINCSACPYGHAEAQGIMDNNPDDVFIINIHTGSYSNPSGNQPDFRTPFGSQIAGQSGLTFYPSGTVNRHIFSGGVTAMGRNEWESATNQMLAQSSYLNVGVEADIDMLTRLITVHVEAYYTGDSPEGINFLNVALLQDSTYAYQSSGGSNYNHMHRLVWMLTEQWGEEITTTSTGSFIDKIYTYTIPTEYNETPVILKDLKIVAFISETHQEIISGKSCYPSHIGNIAQNDVAIESITIPEEVCETYLIPIVNIRNMGEQNLTSLIFEYSVNDGDILTYTWTGNIGFSETSEIVLDEISFVLNEENTISVTAINPNGEEDDNLTNNEIIGSFSEAFNTTTNVQLELEPGSWGFEISWELTDTDETVMYSGEGSNGYTEELFELDLNNCYNFVLYDSYGNGFNSGGYCKLSGTDDIEIRYIEGDFGYSEIVPFKPTTISEIKNNTKYITIYPNPANKNIIINSSDKFLNNVNITDISGKEVHSFITNNKHKKIHIDITSLSSGIYFVNIITDTGIITRKISVIN